MPDRSIFAKQNYSEPKTIAGHRYRFGKLGSQCSSEKADQEAPIGLSVGREIHRCCSGDISITHQELQTHWKLAR